LKEREQLLKKRLDNDDFEFNNNTNKVDSKTLEEKIDNSLEEFQKVSETVEIETRGKDKN
jgi:fibronectin type 3 domain-containing protein